MAQEQALAQADSIIAPSQAVARLLIDHEPELKTRLQVVALGIEDSDLARRAAQTRAQRTNGPVLYVGRFADIKGTAELFTAIPQILNHVPSTHFVIAGGIPDNRKAEARWLRRWSAMAPVESQKRVHFAGWLSHQALAQKYWDARILISPSWFETFGLVVLEAMLHGMAICATRTDSIAELITHERTGLLAVPRDIDTIVRNTVALLEQPERAVELGATAATTARRYHLWPNVIHKLTAAYQGLYSTFNKS